MADMYFDHWTEADMALFKRKLAKAEKDHRQTFTFAGGQFYVPYARYVMLHLQERKHVALGLKIDPQS